MSWCTQWKGIPHDCFDHLRQKHSVPSSAKPVNLGFCSPPRIVTREVWRKTLIQQLSGVSPDVLLFSEHGSTLVHHYRVFGRDEAHTFLRWKFMAKLRTFTVRMAVGVYQSGILLRQWFRIHCAAFNSEIRKMNLPSVKLVWRCPRSCRKCLLMPHP